MTDNLLVKKIKELEIELKKETDKNGNSKRASFLQATINVYSKKLCNEF